jgi:hypothetical protein
VGEATVQPGGACPILQVSKLITLPAGASKLSENNHVSGFIGAHELAQEASSPFLPVVSQCALNRVGCTGRPAAIGIE